MVEDPTNPSTLPIEEILDVPDREIEHFGCTIGRSREERELLGFRFGHGPRGISLIAGCHADEPVGPSTLRHLASWLAQLPNSHRALTRSTWYIVPHVNPDGALRNADWVDHPHPTCDHLGQPDRSYDPFLYARHVSRELPGDDIEFGFPRSDTDRGTRPENLAAAAFLRSGAPFAVHGSFHGMGFASGPWFLLESSWIDRTAFLREQLRERVRAMGLEPLDIDRRGEKGFVRIDAGFSTRPDSRAMAEHFEQLGDRQTAAKFRPSSMEFIRGVSDDPITFVTEMPLFLLSGPAASSHSAYSAGAQDRRAFYQWLLELQDRVDEGRAARHELERRGIRAMPIRDQMRLQLELLNLALAAAP